MQNTNFNNYITIVENSYIIRILFKKLEDKFGEYDPIKKIIYIDFDLNEFNKIDKDTQTINFKNIYKTINHEVWHLICDLYNLNISEINSKFDLEHFLIANVQNYYQLVLKNTEYIFLMFLNEIYKDKNNSGFIESIINLLKGWL